MINIIQIIKNKKSIKEEIGELDDNLVNLRKDLKKMKKETLKNMIFAGQKVPNSWKTKLNFRDMVTKLIESDEKTTKYILENKIIGEKEKDLNINLRKIIMNSPILHKIRASQNPNLFSKFIQQKSRREESADSSDEEKIKSKTNRKEESNDVKENEVFISNSTLENRNKIDNDLKFTFSPMKSIALSKIDSFSKTKKVFSLEYLKNRDLKGLNLIEEFKMQDLLGINYNNINNENSNNNKDSEKQFTEKHKNKNVYKRSQNSIIPFEDDELKLDNLEGGKKELNENNHKNHKEFEKQNFVNQSGTKSHIKESKAVKKLSLNFANVANKLINNKNLEESGFSNPKSNNDLINDISKKSINKIFEKDYYNESKGFNNDLKPIRYNVVNVSRKPDATIRETNSNNASNINNQNQNFILNPLKTLDKDSKNSKDVKSIEEFKKLRMRRINNSIISAHSIIDYSINKSDYVSNHGQKRNNSSAINLLDKDEKERSSLISEKIKIGNEKIKELITKTKEKGHFGPYFSLCRNCNERNNQFYEKINFKNAIGILKAISHN